MFYDRIKEFCREWGFLFQILLFVLLFILFIFAFVRTTISVIDSSDRQWELEQARTEKYDEIAALIEQGNYDCREIYNYNLTQEQKDSLANKCLIYQND